MTVSVVFKPQDRQRLFYNKYQYSVSLTYTNITCLEHANVEHMRNNLRYGFVRLGFNSLLRSLPVEQRIQDVEQQVREYLDEFEPLHSVIWAQDQFVTRSEYRTLGLYSNDDAYLQQVVQSAQQHLVRHHLTVRCTQARVVLPADVVFLSKPNGYNFRSYLSERRLSNSESATVKKFLLSRQDQFHITPRLRNRLMYTQNLLWLSGFLDHVNEQDITLLNLAVPGLVRRTLPIQTK